MTERDTRANPQPRDLFYFQDDGKGPWLELEVIEVKGEGDRAEVHYTREPGREPSRSPMSISKWLRVSPEWKLERPQDPNTEPSLDAVQVEEEKAKLSPPTPAQGSTR